MKINLTNFSEELIPLGQMVLVRVEKSKEKEGLIYIPDKAQKSSQRGEVIAIGKGRVLNDGKREELDVEVGDKIIFTQYMGVDEIEIEGERHLMVRHQDIIAKVKTSSHDHGEEHQ